MNTYFLIKLILFSLVLLLASLYAIKQTITSFWITRPLDNNKYPEFYKLFKELYEKSGIQRKLDIKIQYGLDSNFKLNGQAGKDTLLLPFSVVKRFYNDPDGVFVAKHIIGHELAHLKYDNNENRFISILKNIMMLFNHRLKCESIIIESRADIVSHSITGMSKDEIKIAHDTITSTNSKKSKYLTYLLGYPTNDQRIHIESSHIEFDQCAFDDIINTVICDFLDVFRIRNRETFLNDLKILYMPNYISHKQL